MVLSISELAVGNSTKCEDKFLCLNSVCVDNEKVNNGANDCGDNSDEGMNKDEP